MNIGMWLNEIFYSFDYSISEAFAGFQNAFLTDLSNVITFFGSPEFAVGVAILGIILIIFRRTRKIGMALVFAIIIGTLITNVITKPLVERVRPYITLADTPFYSWYQSVGATVESDRSFPSGHTTAAFEIATVLFLSLRKKYSWVFLVMAFLIGCTRIYLMVHYPSDVLGGIIVGVFAGTTGFLLVKGIVKLYERKKELII